MFKDYSSSSLNREQVISELEKILNLGWEVLHKADESYVIRIDEHKEVSIRQASEKWFVASYVDGLPKFTKYATSVETLVEHLGAAGKALETDLNIEREYRSIRIKADEPFSNKVKLLTLFNKSKIAKIFDPYFDAKSLTTLIALNKLGAAFDEKLLCLTTKSLAVFDSTIIADFNSEGKTNIEIKKCENKEHRRFVVLNDSRVIIMGCSLNDINKNEVVAEESIQELKNYDLNFFNEEWSKSS